MTIIVATQKTPGVLIEWAILCFLRLFSFPVCLACNLNEVSSRSVEMHKVEL